MLVISFSVLTGPCLHRDGTLPGMPEEVSIYFLTYRLYESKERWPVIEKLDIRHLYVSQKLDCCISGAVLTLTYL